MKLFTELLQLTEADRVSRGSKNRFDSLIDEIYSKLQTNFPKIVARIMNGLYKTYPLSKWAGISDAQIYSKLMELVKTEDISIRKAVDKAIENHKKQKPVFEGFGHIQEIYKDLEAQYEKLLKTCDTACKAKLEYPKITTGNIWERVKVLEKDIKTMKKLAEGVVASEDDVASDKAVKSVQAWYKGTCHDVNGKIMCDYKTSGAAARAYTRSGQMSNHENLSVEQIVDIIDSCKDCK